MKTREDIKNLSDGDLKYFYRKVIGTDAESEYDSEYLKQIKAEFKARFEESNKEK